MSTAPSLAQQFTVDGQMTNVKSFQNVDGSVTVGFRVRYNQTNQAPGTISNVVPTLIAPDCAAFNSEVVFNTTYLGRGNVNSPSLGPVSSWANNTTQELVFNIHMFNNSTFCPVNNNNTPISLEEACRTFVLSFTYSGQAAPVEALDPSNVLLFENPVTDGLKIVQLLSQTDPRDIVNGGRCSLYTTSATIQLPLDRFTPDPDIVNDPNNRILWLVNWNLNTNNLNNPVSYKVGIGNLLYPIGDVNYNIWGRLLIPQDDVPLYHSENPQVITDQDGNVFNLDLLGGNGELNSRDCDNQTWNAVDLTNVSVSGLPIRERILRTGQALTTNIDRGSTFLTFRQAILAMVTENRCEFGEAFGLGPSETNFRFNRVENLGTSQAVVSIDVPAAWRSSGNAEATTLDSDYTVRWYYFNEQTFAPAILGDNSGDPTRRLTATLNLPSDPGNFGYQARITHVATGSVVTVDVPADAMAYGALSRPTIANGEADPDEYFDAGELLAMPFQVTNGFSDPIALQVTVGVLGQGHSLVLDANFGNGTGQTDPTRYQVFSGQLAGNQTLSGDLELILAETSLVCDSMTFYVETEYVHNGVTYTTYRTFSNSVNCLLDDTVYPMSGNYVAKELFGDPTPCANSNCPDDEVTCLDLPDCEPPVGLGWQFANQTWTGITSDAFVFHTLTSPAFLIVPTGATISLTHQATFSLLTAGGILEYRTRADAQSPWTPWADLILELEEAQNTNFYNSRTFPALDPRNDQIIAGRNVFMRQTVQQTIQGALPNHVLNGGEISFRFTYQQDTAGDLGEWTISEFTYATTAAGDNEFNPSIASTYNLSQCTPNISVDVASNENLRFSWYTGIQALINDTPASTTVNPTWVNVPLFESGTAYVKVVVDNQNPEATTRIFALNVVVNGSLPSFESLRNAWLTRVDQPGTELDIVSDGEINVLDLSFQVTNSDCEE